MRSGTESLPKVFLHDNCEQVSFIIFFAFLKKEEMRSGTHFTQLNVFLLLTVVVTKHVWPYFQSRFPKTSSERVSSCVRPCVFTLIPPLRMTSSLRTLYANRISCSQLQPALSLWPLWELRSLEYE
jgi:hypothetical protein